MNSKKTVSILGCGWLGLPLAKLLIAKGFNVKGSTTSEHKLHTLAQYGIASILVHFNKNSSISGLSGLVAFAVNSSSFLSLGVS